MLVPLTKVKPLKLELNINQTEEHWQRMDDMIAVLEPVKMATKLLEDEQLTVGSFWLEWTKMKFKLQSVNTSFS